MSKPKTSPTGLAAPGAIPAPISPPIRNGSQDWLIAPVTASHWLAQYPFPYQRGLAAGNVEKIAWALAHGTYYPVGLHLYYCNEKAGWFLVDGQHRLTAAVQSKCPLPETVILRVVPTFADICHAYEHIDAGRPRSIADRMRGAGIEEELNLGKTGFKTLMGAMPVLIDGFESKSVNTTLTAITDVRANACRDWAPYHRLYNEAVTPEMKADAMLNGTILRRSVVAAFAYVTFRWQPEFAGAFWGTVAGGNLLRQGTGEWRLYGFLLANAMKGFGYNEYARRIANCWNASFTGKPLVKLTVKNASAPIHIEGTPYRHHKTLKLSYEGTPYLTAEAQIQLLGASAPAVKQMEEAA